LTAHLLAKTAYSTPAQASLRAPRSVEYDLFAQVTARLKSAAEGGTANFPALASALHDNRKLWTAMAADVAQDGNGLPDTLRARILYLSEFTRLHTSKVLASSDTVDVLIEVNTAIMRGLDDGRHAA